MSRIAKGELSDEQILEYVEKYPEKITRSDDAITLAKVKKKLQEMRQKLATILISNLKLQDFEISEPLKKWVDIPEKFKVTLLLVGNSGSGKTQFAPALAHSKQWKTLIVNRQEKLLDLKPEHKLIFFDNFVFDFNTITENELVLFFDTAEPRQLKVPHTFVERAAGTIQIITMNFNTFEMIRDKFDQPQFKRKVHIEIGKKVFLKPEASKIIHIHDTMKVTYNMAQEDSLRMNRNDEALKIIDAEIRKLSEGA